MRVILCLAALIGSVSAFSVGVPLAQRSAPAAAIASVKARRTVVEDVEMMATKPIKVGRRWCDRRGGPGDH